MSASYVTPPRPRRRLACTPPMVAAWFPRDRSSQTSALTFVGINALAPTHPRPRRAHEHFPLGLHPRESARSARDGSGEHTLRYAGARTRRARSNHAFTPTRGERAPTILHLRLATCPGSIFAPRVRYTIPKCSDGSIVDHSNAQRLPNKRPTWTQHSTAHHSTA